MVDLQAYGAVDADGSRFLLSDYLGNLYLLLLLREDGTGAPIYHPQFQLGLLLSLPPAPAAACSECVAPNAANSELPYLQACRP